MINCVMNKSHELKLIVRSVKPLVIRTRLVQFEEILRFARTEWSVFRFDFQRSGD